MGKQGIRTEFWGSPGYYFSSRAYPTDKEGEFAMLSGEIDSKDHMFMFKLKACTLPSESHRIISDGEAYCQIRTDITKTAQGKTEKGVVKGSYGRAVRIDIMPFRAELPRILKETLEEADYKISTPQNNMTVMHSGLLGEL